MIGVAACALDAAPTMASIDDTFGEDGFSHWEIVCAARMAFERGLRIIDPCGMWDQIACTAKFVNWYTANATDDATSYPVDITTRVLRRAYLEYCCQHRVKPRSARCVQIDLAKIGVGKTRRHKARSTTYRIAPTTDRREQSIDRVRLAA